MNKVFLFLTLLIFILQMNRCILLEQTSRTLRRLQNYSFRVKTIRAFPNTCTNILKKITCAEIFISLCNSIDFQPKHRHIYYTKTITASPAPTRLHTEIQICQLSTIYLRGYKTAVKKLNVSKGQTKLLIKINQLHKLQDFVH